MRIFSIGEGDFSERKQSSTIADLIIVVIRSNTIGNGPYKFLLNQFSVVLFVHWVCKLSQRPFLLQVSTTVVNNSALQTVCQNSSETARNIKEAS